MEQRHTPVLLSRCVELIGLGVQAARETGRQPVVVDATLGMGGHAHGVLSAFPDVTLIGIDRDTQAIDIASRRLAEFGDRARCVHATDDDLPEVLAAAQIDAISAVLFDLGVSSLQLDEDERGFSYSREAPLDMRMDQTAALTAAEVLATYSEAELVRVLRDYGEERQARKIARIIVTDRTQTPWTNSAQLAAMLARVIPDTKQRSHPAKRTFQALRIEVNDELGILARALPAALAALHLGGVAVVESYQSLEDRIVKRLFAAGTTDQAPAGMPVVPKHLSAYLRPVTRGAETASDTEIEANPRAASVRLRAVQKIREDKP